MSDENVAPSPDPVVTEPVAQKPAPTGPVPPTIKRMKDSRGELYVLINRTLHRVHTKEKMSKKERLKKRREK